MVKICPLFSGSSGNCIYVELSEKNAILVDVGRSNKQVENALNRHGIDAENIKAIFVTHEHVDHVSGLKVFIKKHGVKVYGSQGTINALKEKQVFSQTENYGVLSKTQTDLKFVSVKPFSISHDCSEGFGYTFTSGKGEKISICTDLGYVSKEVKEDLKGSKAVVIESNHDTMMLQNGPYPYYLKRRILSETGHLSNDSCAELLPYLVNNGTKGIILSHLSSNNNLPDLAFQTSLNCLKQESMVENKDFSLLVAPRENDNNVWFSF